MMESFGINLQRKTLYEKFFQAHREIEQMMKRKDVSHTEITNMVKHTGELMKNIMQVSIADPSNLKNEHNTLFLSLMDRIKYLKDMEEERIEREKSKSKLGIESEYEEGSNDNIYINQEDELDDRSPLEQIGRRRSTSIKSANRKGSKENDGTRNFKP